MLVISTGVWKLKYFSSSQEVTYTACVVTCQKTMHYRDIVISDH